MYFGFEDFLKIAVAILIGGLIGLEREARDKAAGFRTIILICTGSTLFTIFSSKLGGMGDPVRIAANIVSGVGFLGAGAILRDAGRVTGLTTAATIWMAAALGIGIGGGAYVFCLVAASMMLVVLWLFPYLEDWADNLRERTTYSITIAVDEGKREAVDDLIRDNSLRIIDSRKEKRGNDLVCSWITSGRPRDHGTFVDALVADTEVREFSC
jgi:putative Mg2+ transporter-C (MgtC) family protein